MGITTSRKLFNSYNICYLIQGEYHSANRKNTSFIGGLRIDHLRISVAPRNGLMSTKNVKEKLIH